MQKQQSIDGVLLVDKPSGITSHDVVAVARKCLGTKKIGHCGTLDPLATGLLLLVIGKATKIQDLLMSEDKVYEGTMLLGVTTTSHDADGEPVQTRPVENIDEGKVQAAFQKFAGDFYQTPPMVSAIKKDGVPLYKLARKGQEVERKPRLVHVYNYQVIRVQLPEIDFTVRCSKGFYVRTYAHEIGEILQCGAHIKNLRRVQSGNFSIRDAVTVQALKESSRDQILQSLLSLPAVSRMRGA